MRTKTYLAALVGLGLLAASASAQQTYPNDGSPIGTNLSWVCDWNTQVPWVDMFKWIRGWEAATGDEGLPAAQLDSCGWPKFLNAGETVTVGHGSGTGGHFPGGDYVLTWEGEGRLATRNACSFVSYDSAGHRAVVRVDSTGGWFGISLAQTNPANYIRDIHMIMPGFESTWQADPWHPAFIESHQRYRVLRFKDWGEIDGNCQQVNWSDAKPGYWWNQSGSDYRPVKSGVSPAWMVRTSNRMHADGWFSIPHRATDDYIRQCATLLRDSLLPDLKVYVEYSNECWNTAASWYPQYAYCCSLSQAHGLGQGYAEGYALRSTQIWRVFDEVFGSQKSRVIKVLAGQAGYLGLFDFMYPILDNRTLNPDNQQPTVMSTAPYFNNPEFFAGMNLDTFFTILNNTTLPANRTTMAANVAKARARGCRLVAYEGGSEFYPASSAQATFLNSAVRDPRMKAVYLQYLRNWFDVGGDVFVHYTDVRLSGTETSGFGVQEYYNQPRSESPKYDAMLTFIEDTAGHVRVRQPEYRVVGAGRAALGQPARLFSLNGRLLSAQPWYGPGRCDLRGAGNSSAAGIYVLDRRGSRLVEVR